MSTIKVTTRQKYKLRRQDALFLEEFVCLSHRFLNSYACINLFLRNASEFSTKFSKFRIDCWLDVSLKDAFDAFFLHVDDNHWEFNGFLCFQFTLLF